NPASIPCAYLFVANPAFLATGNPANLVNPSPLDTALAEQQGLGIDKVAQPTAPVRRKSAVDLWGVTNTTTVGFGAFTLKNIFGYRDAEQNLHRDLDGSRPVLVEQVQQPTKNKQTTEELQLRSKSFNDRLDWVVGLFYSEVKNTVSNQQTDLFAELAPLTGSQLAIIDSRVESTVKAVFSQATYDLGSWVEGLKFTAGVRRTSDERDFKGASFTGIRDLSTCRNVFGPADPNAGQPLPGTDPATCERKLHDKYKKTTYNVNLEYAFSEDTFGYVTTRRGFKSGSFNTAAAGGDLVQFAPEILTDYEVGLKTQGELGSTRYRVNTSVFTGKYEDIQAQVPRFDGGNFGVFIINVGEAKIQGFEIEAGWIPLPGFELSAYYGYTDGEYDDDVELTNFAGQGLLSVAKKTAGLGAQFDHQLGPDIGDLSLSSNLNYRGRTPTGYEGTDPKYRSVGGFATLNATIGLNKVLGSNLDVRVYGQNVLDKRAPVTANDVRGTVGYAGRGYLSPRMYGIEANYSF
ncbi:MAG: TonB-dependent receptor, partial [Steroidobacteraceae bacterium]